jgi:hypothetical protein
MEDLTPFLRAKRLRQHEPSKKPIRQLCITFPFLRTYVNVETRLCQKQFKRLRMYLMKEHCWQVLCHLSDWLDTLHSGFA